MTSIHRRLCIAAAGAALFAGVASPAWADEYADTVALFKKAGESESFFKTAYGYAVFPTIGKGGAGIGGAYGKGKVYEKGAYIGETSMTQLSIGFQLGGQGFSQIIFFENADALKKFTAGNFEFGAEASAVAITLGADAKATTTGAGAGVSVEKGKARNAGKYINNMAVFTVVKGGLMYDVSIAGQKYNYKAK